MPRISRMVNSKQKTVYHVMTRTRTALDGFPFKNVEKDAFVNIIKLFSRIYFTDSGIIGTKEFVSNNYKYCMR